LIGDDDTKDSNITELEESFQQISHFKNASMCPDSTLQSTGEAKMRRII
jgi:hypothetical protein